MAINFKELKMIVKELEGSVIITERNGAHLVVKVYFTDEPTACIFKLRCNHKAHVVSIDELQRILQLETRAWTWHKDSASACT